MNKDIVILFILSVFAFISCDNSDPKPNPEPNGESRTVIFYLIGDNSLSKWTGVNINEMLVGVTEKGIENGNLVLYVDDYDDQPYIANIVFENGKAIKKIIREYNEQDSTDPRIMHKVLNDIKQDYITDSYGLVLWSHATAWMPSDFNRLVSTRSFGDDDGNVMDIDKLADALDSFQFDFIMFDACYMGSIEVVYELKDITDYILASPMEVMAKGFPYELIINDFFKFPKADLKGISEKFYKYYNKQGNSDNDPNRTGSVALIDTKNLENLALKTRDLIKPYSPNYPNVNLSDIQATEHLFISDEKSILYDFKDYFKNVSIEYNGSTNYYNSISKALDDVIVYAASTPYSYFAESNHSFKIEKFSGLSIYPLGYNPKLDEWYKRLDWYKAVYE